MHALVLRARTPARRRRVILVAAIAAAGAYATPLLLSSPASPSGPTDAQASGFGSDNLLAATGVDGALWVKAMGGALVPGGGVLAAQPVTAGRGAGTLYIGTGVDHALWVRSAAQSWRHLSARPFRCLDGPGAAAVGATLVVACQGADHALWTASTPLGAAGRLPAPVTGWSRQGGRLSAGPAVATVAGAVTYFTVAPDHHVWTLAPGGWARQPWACSGRPAALTVGTITSFACAGADHALWLASWAGGWSPISRAGGVVTQVVGMSQLPTGVATLVQGTDRGLWHVDLTGWTRDGGTLLSPGMAPQPWLAQAPARFPNGGPPTPTPSGSPSPTATPPGGLKPEISGLLDRRNMPSSSYQSVLGGWVVDVSWSDLQPAAGGSIVQPNAIDQAIAAVRQLQARGTSMHLKVRLFTGTGAPDWAKSLGGAPVTVHDPTDNRTGTIGRFWTPEYGRAYADLQARLAALYDAVPEIEDVTISRCMTVYAETFIRDVRDAQTVHNLLAAGFTAAADQTCHEEQIQAHAVWTQTHSSLSFNPYQVINANGSVSQDEAFTEQMMSYCRVALGDRCVLENNSIRSGGMGSTYAHMYAAMQRLGAPIAFQTGTPAKVGNLVQVLQWAVGQGANAVELPSSYTHACSSSQLRTISRNLVANPQV